MVKTTIRKEQIGATMNFGVCVHNYNIIINNLAFKSSNSVVAGLISNLVEYLGLEISTSPKI